MTNGSSSSNAMILNNKILELIDAAIKESNRRELKKKSNGLLIIHSSQLD